MRCAFSAHCDERDRETRQADKEICRAALKKGYVDFIATDAHNTERRPPLLSKAYRETSGILDKHEADRIFLENPHAVIENREILV